MADTKEAMARVAKGEVETVVAIETVAAVAATAVVKVTKAVGLATKAEAMAEVTMAAAMMAEEALVRPPR